MRVVLCLCITVGLLQAQSLAPVSVDRTLYEGTGLQRIVLQVPRPIGREDQLNLLLGSKVLSPVVVTPDGRRITAMNADSQGVRWSAQDFLRKLGESDGGESVGLHFDRDAPVGQWIVELTALPSKTVTVNLNVFYESDAFQNSVNAIPGYRKTGPYTFAASSEMSLALDRNDSGVVLEIVVSDRAADVTVTAPDGKQYRRPADGKNSEQWFSRFETQPGGLLLRETGMHHRIQLPTSQAGTYRIRVVPTGQPVVASAAIGALGRAIEQGFEQLRNPQRPPGTVFVQPFALPYDVYVGDSVPFFFEFRGEPVQRDFTTTLKVEYRSYSVVNGELVYGQPSVEIVPATFQVDGQGRYQTSVVAKRAGEMRIAVAVRGTSVNRQPFIEESFPVQTRVLDRDRR